MKTRLRGRCSCGALIEIEAPEGFEAAELIGATCQACADQDITDAGGEILPMPLPVGASELPPLFPIGRIAVTAGAVAALADAGLEALAFVALHASGNWGRAGRASEIELSDAELARGPLETSDDGRLNLVAVRTGRGRILSSFDLPTGGTIWVLTDMGPAGVAVTTALLPDEY